MLINKRMVKQNALHTHNGILSNNKTEWTIDTCYINKSQTLNKKPDTKSLIFYKHISMKLSPKENL